MKRSYLDQFILQRRGMPGPAPQRWARAGVLAAAAGLLLAAGAVAQPAESTPAEAFTMRRPLPPNPPKDPVRPPSERFAAADALQTREVRVGPVDTAALLAEDAEDAAFGFPPRVAVRREVMVRMPDGVWQDVPGGRLWSVDVTSEGANGLRLHLAGMDLPPGGELVLYAPGSPQPPLGPYTEAGPLGTGEFLAPTVWGDTVRLEYFQPHDAVAGRDDDAPFLVASFMHWYRDLNADDVGGGVETGVACSHVDASCHSQYDELADAVGLIVFNTGGGMSVCSGTLISTQEEDLTPYFITANHCISNQNQALGAEVIWYFQSNSCNGSVFDPPFSSSFADFIEGGPTSDTTLLMLRGELPNPWNGHEIAWAGWTSIAQFAGTDSVGIHHPAGSFKRITFGDNATLPTCGAGGTVNAITYFKADFTSGVIEGGSSGSGWFKTSTQQLYGIASCISWPGGFDPCNTFTTDGSYGRFSNAYDVYNLGPVLEAGSDDPFEDNDSCEDALPIDEFDEDDLVVKALDEDWFSFTLASTGSVDVHVNFVDPWGDIDAQLINGCDGSVVDAGTSNTNNETITFTNHGPTGEFFLRIFIDGPDTRADYDLTVSIEGPTAPNDVCTNAIMIAEEGDTAFSTLKASTDGDPIQDDSCTVSPDGQFYDDVWYTLFAPCTGSITISVCDADFPVSMAVYDGNSCPADQSTPLACASNGCSGLPQVTVEAEQAFQQFRIRLGGATGNPGTGTLTVTCDAANPCPADVANADGVVDVADLLHVLSEWGDCSDCSSDLDDNGTVDVADLLEVLAAWGDCG